MSILICPNIGWTINDYICERRLMRRENVGLLRDIHNECEKLLAAGANPKITCDDKEHQQYVEDLLAGRVVRKANNRITHDEAYLKWCEIIGLDKEAKKRGLGGIKVGCVDKLYQERIEKGKSLDQQRKEERRS